MALRPATTIIPADGYTYLAVQTEPAMHEGTQQTDRDSNLPVWTVDALRRGPSGESAIVSVKIAAATAPDVTGDVIFEGLVARQYAISGGPAGLSWRADAVRPATQRHAAPQPAKAPENK